MLKFKNKMSVEKHELNLNRKRFIALAVCIIKRKPPDVGVKAFCSTILLEYLNFVMLPSDSIENLRRPILVIDDQICVDSQADLTDDNLTEIYNATFDESDKFNSITHLKIVRSIRCIKNAIIGFNGDIRSSPPGNILELDKLQENIPDSAYKSNSLTSNERNEIEQTLQSLDSSVNILLDFLLNSTNKQKHLCKYASDLLGEVIDSLYTKGVHVGSLNTVMGYSEDVIERLFKNDRQNNKDELLKILYALNKSFVIAEHTMKDMHVRLGKFLEIVSTIDRSEAIELNEIEQLDSAFYALSITEELSKSTIKSNNSEIHPSDDKYECKENEAELFQTLGDGWYLKTGGERSTEPELRKETSDLLNKIVIHCMDSYPLISFWGMEIINKIDL